MTFVGGGKSKEEFARIMANLKLAHPKKIDVAVPANLECGLKIPNVAGEAVEKAWAPIERTGGGVPEVTAGWVKAHLGEFRVLDVREEDEYNGPLSHLPGSELVPLGTVEHGVKDWDRKAPVVTVSANDRPGLLTTLSSCFEDMKLSIEKVEETTV